MQVSFWGVRGSTPSSKPQTWRYGGHTPCLELRAGNQLVIIDAGTGIQELGHELCATFASPGLDAALLLSHYHWDHLQGLPFFEPIYFSGNRLRIFGPRLDVEGFEGIPHILDGIFRAPFFPVVPDQLKTRFEFEELGWESDFHLGELRVRTCRTNHPQGALAYRFDYHEGSLVYATDHEPGDPACDAAVRQLARGATMLISDAQYQPRELGALRAGWGHGSWETAAALARDAGVANLVLFHHDPFRSDGEVDEILRQTRQLFPNAWAAAEGMLIRVSAGEIHIGSRGTRASPRAPLHLPVAVAATEGGHPVRHEGQLENVSFRGAYFLSPRRYELQEPVEIEVNLPSSGEVGDPSDLVEKTIRLRGYVVRIQSVPGRAGWYGIAVHFPDAATAVPRKPEPPQVSAKTDAD